MLRFPNKTHERRRKDSVCFREGDAMPSCEDCHAVHADWHLHPPIDLSELTELAPDSEERVANECFNLCDECIADRINDGEALEKDFHWWRS